MGMPQEIYKQVLKLPTLKEVTIKNKFPVSKFIRYISIGEMYLEYEQLSDSPAPLEVFWQAMIKLLHPIRTRQYIAGRWHKIVEYDLFDKSKWRQIKGDDLEKLIWAHGFPFEGILPRIWTIDEENQLIPLPMWWERNQQNEEAIINVNGE